MKKLLYIIVGMGMLLGSSSCSEFLEPTSPSVVDPDLVFSDESTTRKALLGAYAVWEDRNQGGAAHSLKVFYDATVIGSDAERHAESYSAYVNARADVEWLYGDISKFPISFNDAQDLWTYQYSIISTCNTIIEFVEGTDAYTKFMAEKKPTAFSQVYGEAVALRATAYFELLRTFGDIPHSYKRAQSAEEFTSRDEIYEYHINKLIEVEPVMYRVGESSGVATFMNRTYVQGLIGRMCLYAGGYATRRTDLGADFYKNIKGETLTFTNKGVAHNGAVYSRRTDYLDFYRIAKTYLSACVATPGSAKLIVTDDRAPKDGRQFGNPFQRKYQYMLDRQISPESVYEIVYAQGKQGSERPYSYGRPAVNKNNPGYPANSFGQCRMWPGYYYGDFDNKDLRRDVTVTVTGNNADGTEGIIGMVQGNRLAGGGLCLNKWDESRMNSPITVSRQSGISCLYMSFSDIVLMLAETYAELGEYGLAKVELEKVRSRAFAQADQTEKVTNYINAIPNDGLVDAILQERKLEFGGEGMRRYDLIRTGRFPESIKALRAEMKTIVNNIKNNGFHQFANGNQFPAYIWIKSVDPTTAPYNLNYRLTTQCTDETNPLLFPGWRGQFDDWKKINNSFVLKPASNIAIKGLFKYIDPASQEAKDLVADKYVKTKWGISITDATDGDAKTYADYVTDVFKGYQDAAVTAGYPPIYLLPLSYTTLQQKPQLSNGYGFAQQ